MIHQIGLMHSNLAGKAGGDALVEAPVDDFFTFTIGLHMTPTGFFVPLSTGVHGLADGA